MSLLRRLLVVGPPLFGASFWGSSHLRAATSTTTFNVQITINDACAINSASNLAFGTHGVIGLLGVSATSSITVQCSLLTPFQIGLDAGTGATTAARKLTNGSNTLEYSLYQDLLHLLPWGDTLGTNTVGGLGLGIPQTFTVFGLVPNQPTPPAGTYTDTITVTVTF